MNAPGLPETLLCESGSYGQTLLPSIEHPLRLFRGNVADRFEQALGVELVNPLERCSLNDFSISPRPLFPDDLSLVESDHGLGHRVVVGIAD